MPSFSYSWINSSLCRIIEALVHISAWIYNKDNIDQFNW